MLKRALLGTLMMSVFVFLASARPVFAQSGNELTVPAQDNNPDKCKDNGHPVYGEDCTGGGDTGGDTGGGTGDTGGGTGDTGGGTGDTGGDNSGGGDNGGGDMSSVPEPGTLMLLASGGLLAAREIRRRARRK